MSVVLVRIDDRLIHGQIVVGWVQALGVKRIVLVDDAVSGNEWERELYTLSVPPGLHVEFASVAEATERMAEWMEGPDRTIVLVGNVEAIVELCNGTDQIEKVNVGGLHDATGRTQRLPYVYLSDDEAAGLRALGENGVEVTAQDVPTARPVALGGFT
jgi:PTS system mannose-specific IIB component/fructoselysine and glucoselysine-specific PTS system IIB component